MKSEKLPDIAGTYNGKLVIVGSSRNVWDDLWKIMPIECHVMCINDMICYYPGFIHHAYTNNKGRLDTYWANRRFHYKERYKKTDGSYRKPLMHTLAKWNEHIGWPFPGNGTSAYNACKVALGLGYSEILLCGLPMDDSGHFWEAPWEQTPKGRRPDEQFFGNKHIWENAKSEFCGKVKSMSGNTMELFG